MKNLQVPREKREVYNKSLLKSNIQTTKPIPKLIVASRCTTILSLFCLTDNASLWLVTQWLHNSTFLPSTPKLFPII